jgi:hypothetical protein
MKKATKNLTRYTRDKTSFQGWRVCISRKGMMFTKYFADAAYEGEQGAYDAALALRDEVLARLKADPTNARNIMMEYCDKYAKKGKG